MERWVVAYDIPDDGRRRRVAAILDDYGDRVQGSVFEVIAAKDDLERVRTRLAQAVDPEEDSVRLYPACSACAAKVVCMGTDEPEPWWEPEVYIV